jgi:hypothetical protein
MDYNASIAHRNRSFGRNNGGSLVDDLKYKRLNRTIKINFPSYNMFYLAFQFGPCEHGIEI